MNDEILMFPSKFGAILACVPLSALETPLTSPESISFV